MSVARFIVQYRIAILLKRTLLMQKFVDRMENETVDVKQLGLVGRTKEQILQELVELYALQ